MASDELEALGYLQYMRTPTPAMIAGGYTAQLGCFKALQEARVDLLSF